MAESAPGGRDGTDGVNLAAEGSVGLHTEMHRELIEKEAQIQAQNKALKVLRAVNNLQDATIARLESEIASYREATPDLAHARERSRELDVLRTHVGVLEETVATRGALLDEQLRRIRALQSEREQFCSQLKVLRRACDDRLAAIESLSKTAADRLKVIEQLSRSLYDSSMRPKSERK